MQTNRHTLRSLLFTVSFLSVYVSLSLVFQLDTFAWIKQTADAGNGEFEDMDNELIQVSRSNEEQLPLREYFKRSGQASTLEEDSTSTELSQIFNSTCPKEYLGLLDYAREICINESAEVCRLLSCRSFLSGSGTDLIYGRARLLMKKHPRKPLPDESFIRMTSNCEKFKRLRGYRLKPVNREEEEFPIAFNIMAHTNAGQVERLIRSLYRPQNVFCIHVDAKAPDVFRNALRSIASCFDNVRLASKSERIIYAGYSRLQADINCMQDNLKSKIPWRYLINTAAQAYPLRTVTEMVRILKIYNGANDIEGLYGRHLIRQRFDREWVETTNPNEVVQTGKANPRPPHDIDIVRGSAYGVFSRGFVQFILEDNRAIDLLNWSRKTFSPDEHYWATLHHTYTNPHLHTPGGFSGYPNNKTWMAVYANWDELTCRGKLVHQVCVFGLGDLPALVERRELFANKFYEDFEPLALDCLEAWIHHKDECPVPLNEPFYRSLEFVKET